MQPRVAPQKPIHILSGLLLQSVQNHPCRTNSVRPGRNCSCFLEPEISWNGDFIVLADEESGIAAPSAPAQPCPGPRACSGQGGTEHPLGCTGALDAVLSL